MSEKQYRDSLFRHYFSDKIRLLSLVNALIGTDATDPNELEINTIDGSFSTDIRNDISCLFRNRFLVLIEQQSTVNQNMPARFLFYLAELMKKIVGDHTQFYRRRLIEFPEPEFFVIYNGLKSGGNRTEMRLSEAFHNSKNIELVAKFIDVREGQNEELLRRSEYLTNYCVFVNRVMQNTKNGMQLSAAIQETQDYCIRNGVMSEYLREHYWEVAKLYIIEYDREKMARMAHEDGVAEGREEGLAKGREQERLVLIKNLLNAGTPIKYIEAATGWSEEQILASIKSELH